MGDQGNDLATVNTEENQAHVGRNKPRKGSIISGDNSGNLQAVNREIIKEKGIGLHGLDVKQMELGLENNSSYKIGSMTTGTFTQKAHDKNINILRQASEVMEVPQEITLDKTKHTVIRVVPQQKPISFGPQNMQELKEGGSMLLRTGKPLILEVS